MISTSVTINLNLSQLSVHQIQTLASLTFNSSSSNAMVAQSGWKYNSWFLIKRSYQIDIVDALARACMDWEFFLAVHFYARKEMLFKVLDNM